jgi:hypothetical protein
MKITRAGDRGVGRWQERQQKTPSEGGNYRDIPHASYHRALTM